jgi:hypothetical protein
LVINKGVNLVALLSPSTVYAGADGKKYSFGFWNDTPVPGTTLVWQVIIWNSP